MRTELRVVGALTLAVLLAPGCAEAPSAGVAQPAVSSEGGSAVPVAPGLDELLEPVSRFDAWRAQYLAEAHLDRRTALLPDGFAAAAARRRSIEQLIRFHPDLALRAAMSQLELEALPESIRS